MRCLILIKTIIKRDGRKVPYEISKIQDAILMAATAVEGSANVKDNIKLAEDTAKVVNEKLNETFTARRSPTVEQVQDIVEKSLISEGHAAVAKEYILYRAERNRTREMKADLMKIFEDLTFKDAEESDIKRENGNIDSDTAMGTMLKYGSEAAKEFNHLYLLDRDVSEAHKSGDIHIHDFDFAGIGTLTCVQDDLDKLFNGGFSTGHGYLREPESIRSYSALTAIALQCSQNEMHGGQSIPFFDFYLSKGVAKTYVKEILEILEKRFDIFEGSENYQGVKIKLKEGLKKYNYHLLQGEGKKFVYETLKVLSLSDEDIDVALKIALKSTEKETYQAMEALVHNLNSMHCLPEDSKIFIWRQSSKTLELITMKELYQQFKNDTFFAISLNKKTGVGELKRITQIEQKGKNRNLVELTTVTGQKVVVTDNHKIMTVSGSKISETFPKDISSILAPRNVKYPVGLCDINIEKYGEVYKNTRYLENHVFLTEDLAYLFGMYVGDGSIVGGDSTLVLTVCDKITKERVENLISSSFNNIDFANKDIFYNSKIKGNNSIKEYRYNIGVRLGRMFKDLCGDSAKAKKIPSIIFTSSKEIQMSFLKGYFLCDGRQNSKYSECSTISENLNKQLYLLILSLGELPSMSCRYTKGGYSTEVKNLSYELILGNRSSKRIKLKEKVETAFEIPKYDNSYLRKELPKDILKILPRRKNENIYMKELEDILVRYNLNNLEKNKNFFNIPIKEKKEFNSGDKFVFDISVEDNETFLTEDCIYVHNSRAGAQVPFTSLNLGTDTSEEGRMVTRNLLLATEAGLGAGETPIFPISIFRVMEGVNYNPEDPNYDLFKLSMKVSAKRLFPTYEFQDAPFNKKYLTNDWHSQIATMGCRTRVISNIYNIEKEVVSGRGNCSFTSINLPRIGIESHGDLDKFFELLESKMLLVKKQLQRRLDLQGSKHVYNFPFLMGQGIWIDSEKLGPNDTLYDIICNGSLSIGFIGLAECLVALIGEHHGQSDRAQELGLKIVGRMRELADEWQKEEYTLKNGNKVHLNWSILGTPAEGLSGTFIRKDKKKYGIIPGVTDKDYYTNSSHIPVGYPISFIKKIKKEAPYHALENAGHICYIEFDGDATQNLDAFEAIIRCMKESGVGYGAVNIPVDRDPVCGYTGIIGDICPKCGRDVREPITQTQIDAIRKKFGLITPFNLSHSCSNDC